ncbi:hypothetical protein CTEN210_06120 [Chaetoceros tenuissimus]|uniref:Circumsporozoite protein n=2 Tax=Chaetoceros tenuissimus TaxID=426638 RepID=A0AAD3CPV8_9STRA|nr:hypothetical protein CTEN210_06120 [Chaetoceros tenuissimus]
MSGRHKIILSQQWTILFFTVTLVLQTIVHASNSHCSDSVESCSWIRDQDESNIFKACQNLDTRDQCMISCGICCADNPFYRLTTSTGESQSCSWLAGYRSRKEKYCNGQTATECARSCDYCMDYVPLTAEPSVHPSSIPSIRPSPSPSHTPSVSPTFTPSSIPSVTKSATPSSFPSMKPSIRPSASPTVSPSARPSSLPSLIPSREKSVHPTSSSAPSSYPTFRPSGRPTSTPTAFCRNNDSYDVVYKGQTQSCSWIRDQDESNIFKACQNLDTRDQCMISCGICCADNPFYRLTTSTGESQSCSWLAGYRSRKEKYCNGQTATECARSCDYCMDYVPLTAEPSVHPSSIPSIRPTTAPTVTKTSAPSMRHSQSPSAVPTFYPSILPTTTPSVSSSVNPSVSPSFLPSFYPSVKLSSQPSSLPSQRPSIRPSISPSFLASTSPSIKPSESPLKSPSSRPSENESLDLALGTKTMDDSTTSYEISTILLITLLVTLFVAGAVVAYFRDKENPKVVHMDFVEDIDDHIAIQNSFLEIVVNRKQ